MPNFLDAGTNDFMLRSTSLRIHGAARTFFDPTNPEHCESLKSFLETGSWGKIQFLPEFPYSEVPATVLGKFASHHLKVHRLSPTEKAQRAADKRSTLADISARNLEKGAQLVETPDPADLSELIKKATSPLRNENT